MDMPLTICTVITLQFSDGEVPAYVDGKETFVFFGAPTASDFLMVEEYIEERALFYGTGALSVAAQLTEGGDIYGQAKHINIPDGSITSFWEQM